MEKVGGEGGQEVAEVFHEVFGKGVKQTIR